MLGQILAIKICVITYGPDVWNFCHFPLCAFCEMKAPNKSREELCKGSGFAPGVVPGPHNSQCPRSPYFYRPPFWIAFEE